MEKIRKERSKKKTLVRVQREGKAKDKEGKVRMINLKKKKANETKYIKEKSVKVANNLGHIDMKMDGKNAI